MLEYRDDVASDMSVFHRVEVEEVEQMPARRYFMLATRLPAYSGAVTARFAAAERDRQASVDTSPPASATAAHQAASAVSSGRTGVRTGPHPGSAWSFATAGGDG